MPNKIGILTYYWPPAGGSGVQRWIRFSDELIKLGYEIYIFTYNNPKYPVKDISLESEINSKIIISKINGFEIPSFLTRINKNKSESFNVSNKSIALKLKLLLREVFLFPDARKFLINPSVKFINKFSKKHGIDLIITSGPPHSLHMVGLKLKQKNHIKWIADFRDPWANFFQNKLLNTLTYTNKRHIKSELKILKNADAVFTTSKSLNHRFLINSRSYYIPSGFSKNIMPVKHKKFRLLYAGTMKNIQNPHKLWLVLNSLIDENKEFRESFELVLIGNISSDILKNEEIKKLKQNIDIYSYMSKKQLDNEIALSSLLLISDVNLENSNDIVAGKFFHYLSSNIPIIGITGNGSDLKEIIHETNSGACFHFENYEDLKNYIYNAFVAFKTKSKINPSNSEKYRSSNIAKNISEIISKI